MVKFDETMVRQIIDKMRLVAYQAFQEGFIRAGGNKPTEIDEKVMEAWRVSHVKELLDRADPFQE